MLQIHRTIGPDIGAVARDLVSIPTALMPYAGAIALTRVAQHAAKTAVPDEMRRVFDQPVPYVLNSLRVEPASKDKLQARVAVKDQASGGVAPQSPLLAEVQGGVRRRTRTENALGYSGLLASGGFALPGKGMELDSAGNVRGGEIRTILNALKSMRGGAGATKGRGKKLANSLFVGTPKGARKRHAGIYRREGKRLRRLYTFVDKVPAYRPRLNFDGVVSAVAQERFKYEFDKAVREQLARRNWN